MSDDLCPGCGLPDSTCEMSTRACPQRLCCQHQTRVECTCPQGYRSHAMAEDETECVCGKIQVREEAWANCSGQTHVFQRSNAKCGCGERMAATVETV